VNSRERILAAMQCEEADRVPCSPHISGRMVEQMSAQEWAALRKHTDVTMVVSALGDDAIFGGQAWLDHQQFIVARDTSVSVVETPLGPLRSQRVITREASWIVEYYFKSPGDVERLLSIPYAPPRFDLGDYFGWEKELGEDGLVALGIPSAFRFCLGFFGSEQLYLMIADDVDLIERLVRAMNERLARYVQACCQRGVRSFWMGGSEHCGPGVVHPPSTAESSTITPTASSGTSWTTLPRSAWT